MDYKRQDIPILSFRESVVLVDYHNGGGWSILAGVDALAVMRLFAAPGEWNGVVNKEKEIGSRTMSSTSPEHHRRFQAKLDVVLRSRFSRFIENLKNLKIKFKRKGMR